MSVEIDGREYGSWAQWLEETYGGGMRPEDQRYPVVVHSTTTFLVYVQGTSDGVRKGETAHERAARTIEEDGNAYELWEDLDPIGGYWTGTPASDHQVAVYGTHAERTFGPQTTGGTYLSVRSLRLLDEQRSARLAERHRPATAVQLPAVQLRAGDVAS